MFTLNEYEEYESIINGIRFICEEPEDDFEKTASKIAEVYESRLNDIVQFLLEEGITDTFGEFTPGELIEALGAPCIDLDRETISYLEHSLDDTHIIEFEYSGLLEEFSYLSIDG